jgi:lysophospholipase L1-like esterase
MRPLSIFVAGSLLIGLSGGAQAVVPDRATGYAPGSTCRITGSVNDCAIGASDTAKTPLLFFLGDSNSVTAKYQENGFYVRNTGYPAWVAPMTGQRVRAVLPADATSGFTCEKVLSVHVPAVIAAAKDRPSIAAVMCGTNDVLVGIPYETTVATLDHIYAALKDAGIRVIALPIYPHAPADQPAYDEVKTAKVTRLNAWIAKRVAGDPTVRLADYGPRLLEPGSTLARPDYFYKDGRHTIAAGAMIVARAVARTVDTLLPPTPSRPVDAGSLTRRAAVNDRVGENRVTEWTAGRDGQPKGTTLAVRRSNGPPHGTIASLSGRADGSTVKLQGGMRGSWSAGDAIEAEVTISWAGISGVDAVYLGLSVDGAQPFASYDLFGDAISGSLPPSSKGDLVLRTRSLAIPAGATKLDCSVYVRTSATGVAAGSVTVSDAKLYRHGRGGDR